MASTRKFVFAATAAVAFGAAMWPAVPAAAVVGGTNAPGYYPYFAKVEVLFADGVNQCGGSVIAESFVLSGCCFEHDTPYRHIRHDEWRSRPGRRRHHPLFNGNTADGHDLALIDVGPSRTAGITPVQVCAPADPGAYAPGTLATMMGYGRTSAGGEMSDVLLAVDTVLRSDDYMDDLFNPWYWYDKWPDRFAIGAGSQRQTVCNGDSGGPLVVYRNDVVVQVGVASLAKKSCNAAAGFAELSGAQLAWFATQVPSIMARWGTCQTEFGTPGVYSAQYTTTPIAGAQRDGAFSEIACGGSHHRLVRQPPPHDAKA
jgi:hypothetical protein